MGRWFRTSKDMLKGVWHYYRGKYTFIGSAGIYIILDDRYILDILYILDFRLMRDRDYYYSRSHRNNSTDDGNQTIFLRNRVVL